MQSKNFIVYKSSAGSGKTFTLVKEYLKLALVNKANLTKDYKGILAITFTNKAASEMKWRIIKALKEISTDTNTTLTELVAKELTISSLELKSRAEIVLTNILHRFQRYGDVPAKPDNKSFDAGVATTVQAPGNTTPGTFTYRCAAFSIDPQDGSGGCCPRPRNDSDASAMMAAAMASVQPTSTCSGVMKASRPMAAEGVQTT